MKTLLTLATTILLTSLSHAAATPQTTIQCQYDFANAGQQTIGNLDAISFSATMVDYKMVRNPVVSVKASDYNDEQTVTVARRDWLQADENYRPTKYVGHARFDLYQMIDTAEFRNFLPGDGCQILLMLPTIDQATTTFKAPAVIHCDQSGGSITLQCTQR